MPALVIHTPKKSLIRLLACSIAFVATCIWMLTLPDGSIGFTSFLAAYAGIPFFGLCGLYILSRLLSSKPALVVDEKGLFDNASAVHAGAIAWSEIRGIQVSSFQNQRFLAVYVDDPEKYLARANPLKRAVMRANQSMVGTAITIPLSALSMSPEEFLAEAGKYLRSDAMVG